MTHPPERHPHDPDYYLSDGDTVFLVDGVLFKVRSTKVLNKFIGFI